MPYISVPIHRPGADVSLTLQIIHDAGEMVCGLRFLRGRISLGPKAMRTAMHEELSKIEGLAREAGCTEMRHAGNDLAWCLPGYEPMPELPNGRRKKL